MRGRALLAAVCLMAMSGCNEEPPAARQPKTTPSHSHPTTEVPPKSLLRPHEGFVTLAMPAAYTPKAPTYGTDDYRCFLLDPELTERTYVTGVDVLLGNPEAVYDVAGRFGDQASFTVAGLQLICGGSTEDPKAGPVQRCDREVKEAGTVRAIAGHMHMLGRRITIELNPGTPSACTLLDVHPWNFDEQGSVPVNPPAAVRPGDTLRVTCRHDQGMRDLLPALRGIPERYVDWGEGTTDEMCLGIVLTTKN